MIPVCIFTFDQDGPAAMIAGQQAIRTGLGPVFIEVDIHHPLPPALRMAMMKEGFRVRETRFPRVGNIRGLETFRGLFESYRHVLKQSSASHVLKVDSDTIVNRGDLLDQAVRDDVAAAAASTDRCRFHGCAMLMSARLVHGVLEYLDRFHSVPGHRDRDLAEDIATYDMAVELKLGEVRQWPYSPEKGFAAGWQFNPANHRLYYDRFDAVTFGNRHLLTGSTCARRDQVADAMSNYLKDLREAGLPV